MCNNYCPTGDLDTSSGSCSHKCACGFNTWYGCWYEECQYYTTCPMFDAHYWDEVKRENREKNAAILAERD